MELVRFVDQQIVLRLGRAGRSLSFPIAMDQLKKVVGDDLKAIKEVHLECANGSVNLSFTYETQITRFHFGEQKLAGLDLGITNIAAIFIDDPMSPSFVIDGSLFSSKNAELNRKLAKTKADRDKLKPQLVWLEKAIERESDPKEQKLLESLLRQTKAQISQLSQRISRLHSYRNQYLANNFHKLARRLAEDLAALGVSQIILSKNLNHAKNTKGRSLGKRTNQTFYGLPLGQLVDYIELVSGEYGIEVKVIDEAYSSKCSCLSGDSYQAQTMRDGSPSGESGKVIEAANVFGGKRVA